MAGNSNIVIEPLNNTDFQNFIFKIGKFDIDMGPWIAGGSVRKVWQGLDWEHQDVDVFFRSERQLDDFKTNLLKLSRKNIKTRQIEFFDDLDLTSWFFDQAQIEPEVCASESEYDVQIKFESDNAITFSISKNIDNQENIFKVQLINKRFHKNYRELIDNFDFTVCQFLTDGKDIYTTTAAQADCRAKRICEITGTSNSITPIRMLKYMAYGFVPDDHFFVI